MARPEFEMAVVGDIGGTNMRIGVANIDGVVDSRSEPTPQDPEMFFNVLGGMVENFAYTYGVDVAALGFPGAVGIDAEDGIEKVGPLPNVAGLNHKFYLLQELAETVTETGVRLVPLNDAEAATYAAPSLLDLGDFDPKNDMVTFITQSTGVGGESIKDGVIASRASGMLGEYGWIPLLDSDGSYQPWEYLVSGPAISNRYGGGKLSVAEIAATINPDEVWPEVGQNMARGLAALTPVLGTKHFVIGGGVTNHRELYEDYMREEFDRAMSSIPEGQVDIPTITFVPKDELNEIGLRGAFFAARQYAKANS